MITHKSLEYVTNGSGNYRNRLSEYSYDDLINVVRNYVMNCPSTEGCSKIESALNNIIETYNTTVSM